MEDQPSRLGDHGRYRTNHARLNMDTDNTNGVGSIGLAVVSAVTACFLAAAWQWTAQFSWSSESWLISIPMLIILCGLISVITLIAIAVKRVLASSDLMTHQAGMTAERRANARMNRSVMILICGVVLISLSLWLLPDSQLGIVLQSFVVVIVGGATSVAFIRTIKSRKTRCPSCSNTAAEFVERGHLEFLTCSQCGFDEPTGYDYSS